MQGRLNIVPFVSVDNMMKLVLAIGIERFLTGLAAAIEEDFRRWELFDKTPRIASHSAEGVIELMPTSDGTTYGFKYVNGHPRNTRQGRQTVTAFGVLADVGNGYPMLLTEMTILTALRTAATSALAAKYLAPKDARVMAVIGNGAQAEFQAMAFRTMLGIDRLRLHDIDRAATEKCIRNLAGLGFDITQARGRRLVGHGGSMPGFQAAVRADREGRVGVAVLTNSTAGPGAGLTDDLLDLLTTLAPASPKPPAASGPTWPAARAAPPAAGAARASSYGRPGPRSCGPSVR